MCNAPYARICEVFEIRTQTELADILGVRQSSVSDALRRNSIPDSWLLAALRRKQVNPDWIISGEGPRYLVLAHESPEQGPFGAAADPSRAQPPGAASRPAAETAEGRGSPSAPQTMPELVWRLYQDNPEVKTAITAVCTEIIKQCYRYVSVKTDEGSRL